MRLLRVALDQMNATVGALQENADRIIDGIRRASEMHADVVAFPELALTGYPPEDLVLKPEFIADNLRQLERVASAVGDITAVVGFVDTDGSDVYNAAAIIQQGHIVGVHHKHFLPNYSVFDEHRYFRAGERWAVFTVRGVKIGVTICEDIWYPTGPHMYQAIAGAEVLVNINASPFRSAKHEERYRMIATRASDEVAYVCYVNLVAGQDELVFEGASMICDQNGERIAQGRFFEEDFVVADLDVDAIFSSRLRDTRRRQSGLHTLGPSGECGEMIETPLARPIEETRDPVDSHICPTPGRCEEMFGALVLGTRDYVRKSGFTGVVIGLSGGIDSSLTAAIAVVALGAENVLGVLMPSRYSSEGSTTDARLLAENLNIQTLVVPIEAAFEAFEQMLAAPFRGMKPDITEENLQARVRGNILMALSNKMGTLVLTTGNKSEMAVGYSTLYGDLAGGFAVLKDVFKTSVFAICEWLNESRGTEVIPRTVLEKPPSAELRPDQRDEDSLPPYPALDAILRLYVEDDRSSTDIVAMGFDAETVTRVITLVEHSEYKRRQAPPGPRVTTRNFGKDRRLPIVNRYRDLPDVPERRDLEPVAVEAESEALRHNPGK
jgi:NAD+ synthase (glutamine-hydrolysing)